MKPGVVTMGQLGHRLDRIEATGIHLSGRRDDDRRGTIERLEAMLEAREIDPPARIPRQHLHRRMADAQHAQRLPGAGMDEAAAHHRDGREAAQASRPDVEGVLLAPPLSSGGQRGEVRHGRAGGQHAAPVGG